MILAVAANSCFSSIDCCFDAADSTLYSLVLVDADCCCSILSAISYSVEALSCMIETAAKLSCNAEELHLAKATEKVAVVGEVEVCSKPRTHERQSYSLFVALFPRLLCAAAIFAVVGCRRTAEVNY